MSDLEPILCLWRELKAAGTDYVLATVVAVEGSSYRRPGARMLLAQDGRRAGTVSGGCLEAEVAKRAWWMTANGPVVEQFSTFADDGERPYGSGCGGVVSILLERRTSAAPLLCELQKAFDRRAPLAIATALDGTAIGYRGCAGSPSGDSLIQGGSDGEVNSTLGELADLAWIERASIAKKITIRGRIGHVWAEYLPARPGFWILGAGDDAKPLLRLARELGWFVTVADGRSHLATRERFAAADDVRIFDIATLPGPEFLRLDLRATDAAVVMTHSFEQDSRLLASLLCLEIAPAYIGVLGPLRRTRELLSEAARLLGRAANDDQIDAWLAAIHAPTGIDLGADAPASIALSILAEVQQTLANGTGRPLRAVRANRLEFAPR